MKRLIFALLLILLLSVTVCAAEAAQASPNPTILTAQMGLSVRVRSADARSDVVIDTLPGAQVVLTGVQADTLRILSPCSVSGGSFRQVLVEADGVQLASNVRAGCLRVLTEGTLRLSGRYALCRIEAPHVRILGSAALDLVQLLAKDSQLSCRVRHTELAYDPSFDSLRIRLSMPSPSPDASTVTAKALFLGLPEDFSRSCVLTWYKDGVPYRQTQAIIENGAVEECSFSFVFSEQMPETARISVRLSCAPLEALEHREIPLSNYSPEYYERLAQAGLPYRVEVLRNQNVVLVYGLDEDGGYTVLQNAFLCSTGRATPSGSYAVGGKAEWNVLFGSKSSNYQSVYGQYATHIVGNILFHTVPYFTPDKGDLEYEQYALLGTSASMGCIRMDVESTKWIYDHCPMNTRVKIYDSDELPVILPTVPMVQADDARRGWDPTDPDEANPWVEQF